MGSKEQAIADIVETTANGVIGIFEGEIQRLVTLHGMTPWWKFRKRRRLKRGITQLQAINSMQIMMGVVQIAAVMATPIPKYPNGISGISGIVGDGPPEMI